MGLILPRNPLVYPGGRPGFNPAHVAAKGARYSGVPISSTGIMVSLLNAQAAPKTGTVTGLINGNIGPAINVVTGTSYLLPVGVNETALAVTLGAIVMPTVGGGTTFGNIINNDNTFNTSLYLNSNELRLLVSNTSIVVSNVTLAVGSPYFVAASYIAGTVNFIIVNLLTGQVSATSGTTPATAIRATSGGAYLIGGTTGGTNMVDGNIAAAMYSVNNYLSLQQLQAWAKAPWDYWYPPTVKQTFFSAIKKTTAVNNLSFALTDPVETAAFTLTESDRLSFALTDPVETASFTLTEKDQFHFALTDPVETAAFTLTDAHTLSFALTDPVETASFTLTEKDQFHFALTDPVEVASFTLSNVKAITFALTDPVETAHFTLSDGKTIHFALTDAVETAHFTLTSHAPIPQPGPQAAFPLRERTYRRRFVGVGYDPRFTVSKDRPGPLRIIEFIGEIKE